MNSKLDQDFDVHNMQNLARRPQTCSTNLSGLLATAKLLMSIRCDGDRDFVDGAFLV
jgi:hypothetical protein